MLSGIAQRYVNAAGAAFAVAYQNQASPEQDTKGIMQVGDSFVFSRSVTVVGDEERYTFLPGTCVRGETGIWAVENLDFLHSKDGVAAREHFVARGDGSKVLIVAGDKREVAYKMALSKEFMHSASEWQLAPSFVSAES